MTADCFNLSVLPLQRQEAGAVIEEDEEEGSQPAGEAAAASQRTAGPVRALVLPLQLPQAPEALQQQEQAAPVRPLATRRLGGQERQADESGELREEQGANCDMQRTCGYV